MSADRENYRHPNGGDLYTPVTPEVLQLFERMRAEHGTWRKVAALTGTRLKVLYNLRHGTRKAISQRKMDQMITGTGVGGLHEFVWFEANDLVALGIWDPVLYVEGEKRVQGGVVSVRTKDEIEKARKQAKARKKAKKRAERLAARKMNMKMNIPPGRRFR